MQQAAIPVEGINVDNIIALTARLAQVLAQEADYLSEMKVSEIEPLQKEKLILVAALEKHKKMIEHNPQWLDAVDPEAVEDLRQVVDIFNAVRDENFYRLTLAREVNHKIIEAIKEVALEDSRKKGYTASGESEPHMPRDNVLSVTLDKKI
jgi:flagellar biosynthesis/type III secretory pathway chaperone